MTYKEIGKIFVELFVLIVEVIVTFVILSLVIPVVICKVIMQEIYQYCKIAFNNIKSTKFIKRFYTKKVDK